MNKTKNKSIFAIIAMLIILLLAGIFLLIPKTYSAEVNIRAQGEGVTVYVNGKDVQKINGEWYSSAGSNVTVSVINESRLFESMTITLLDVNGNAISDNINVDGNSYVNGFETTDQVVFNIAVPENGSLDISVKTKQPTAEDKGTYFGNPYLISNGESVSALSRILDGKGTDEDFARFNVDTRAITDESTEKSKLIDKLAHGYYRLINNILITSEHFTGIGTPKYPFHGCFDFNGFNASLKIVKTQIDDNDFMKFGDANTMVSYGFFSYIYGDGAKPCLIRNADVRGSIAVNLADTVYQIGDSGKLIIAGGVAGVIGKHVQLDSIYSEVSISVRANNESLYLGGVFGFCSSPVNSWCNATYGGSFSNISGITLSKASAFVGGFTGLLQNAYVNNFTVEADHCTIIANSLGGQTGVAVAGGFAGAVFMKESQIRDSSNVDIVHPVRDIVITDVTININNNVEIVSVVDSTSDSDTTPVIDPDNMEGHSFAISSGFIGTVYCDEYVEGGTNYNFTLGKISFTNKVRSSSADVLKITAQTNDADCYGAVFAGGLIGYVRENAAKKLTINLDKIFAESKTDYTLFDCSAEISAIQNGVGPAYSGGFFGYKAFNFDSFATRLKFNLCSTGHRVDCIARQSPTSHIGVNKAPYECLAGFFSSKLPYGYNFGNCEFIVPGGSVSAERNVGSTAIGEIAAGGFAGIVSGNDSRKSFTAYNGAGELSNIKMNFSHNIAIKAACYSYVSKDEARSYFNNVYAGGFVGLAADYNKIDNITVDFNAISADEYATYSVSGVQNGVSGNGDLKTEGFVGGVFGFILDTPCSNILLNGEKELKSRVYFESTASPDTASVGGVAGGSWSLCTNGTTLLSSVILNNIRVIGKAYTDTQGYPKQPYDLYVGGAVGVAGVQTWLYSFYDGIVVNDCIVEAIGENKMLTYAGGVFGGVWWEGRQSVTNCVVNRSLIMASSVSHYAYAGGIAGLIQKTNLSKCAVLASVVSTEAANGDASSAGIFAYDKDNASTARSCSSSARLSAEGKTTYIAGIGQRKTSAAGEDEDNYFVNERAQTQNLYYNNSADHALGNLHLADISAGEMTNDLKLNTGDTNRVYPHLATGSSSVKLGVSDNSVANVEVKTEEKVEGDVTLQESYYNLTALKQGITYVYAYTKLNVPMQTDTGIARQDTQYILCSYPVTVDGVVDNNFQGLIYKKDNGDELTMENSSVYKISGYEHNTNVADDAKTVLYDYFVVDVGNPGTVFNKINVFPDSNNGMFLSAFKIYSVDPEVFNYTDATTGEIKNSLDDLSDEDRLKAILEKKPSEAIKLDSLNGRISVLYDYGDDGKIGKMSMKAYQILRYHEIVVVEYDAETLNVNGSDSGKTCGMVVEFRPNAVESMIVSPSESTPALATIEKDGEYQYVFAPGDTIRFDVVFNRKYDTYGHYAVKVEFTGPDGTTVDYVRPNGTVYIPETGYDSEYKVLCNAIDYGLSEEITIIIKESLDFEFELSGADVDSDRKMLAETDFLFSSTPHPGYGMRPTIAISSGGISATDITWGDSVDGKGKLTFNWNGSALWLDYTEGYEYSYDFIMPKETVNAFASLASANVKITITYVKTYYLAFISNYGENSSHYFMVPIGHVVGNGYDGLNEGLAIIDGGVDYEPLKDWMATLDRSGFDMRGFYLVRYADSRSGYGTSFEQMVGYVSDDDPDTGEMVNGALRFYARWTYNVSVAAPEGVTVESGFSDEMLQESGSLIPIDENKGFSFVINTPENWEGTPRFSVFVMKNQNGSDGTVTMVKENITALFKQSAVTNGYEIDADSLASKCADYGYIYLNVYADSLDFYVGDGVIHDVDNLYSDGVFTLEYSLNRVDTTIDDVEFDFDLTLPEKTSARLYYRKNGVTVWSGGYVVPSGGTNKLALSSFASMSGATIDRSGIAYEKFILVVTLPNNYNNFAVSGSLAASASVKGYTFTPTIKHYGNDAEMPAHDFNDIPFNTETFTFYPPMLRNVVLDGTKVKFSIAAAPTDAPTDLVDYRHRNVQYVWGVEKIDGGVAVDGSGDLTDFSAFGFATGWTKTADTVLGVYYLAEEGEFDISSLPSGYKLTLLEVSNSRQPSEGLALYEIKNSGSVSLVKILCGEAETPTT